MFVFLLRVFYFFFLDFVTCIFEEIASDPSELVVKILTFYHRSIVLNTQISKNMKLIIFNQSNCKQLMNLYFHNCTTFKPYYSDEEKEKIKKALHQLMITLFSDITHGIIFRESNSNESKGVKSFNMKAYLILKILKEPWEFEEGRELISKAVTVCPSIAALLMESITKSYVFDPVLNHKFYMFLKFIIILEEKHKPLIDLERQIHTGSVLNCRLLIFPLSIDFIEYLLEDKSSMLRHFGLMMLHNICSKAKDTLSEVDQKDLNNLQKDELKKVIFQEVYKISKVVNKMTDLWHLGLKIDESIFPNWYKEEYPTKFSHLASVVGCFCLLCELFGFACIKDRINSINILNEILELAPLNKENVEYYRVVKLILELILIGQKVNDFQVLGFLTQKTESDEQGKNINEMLFSNLIKIYCTFQCDKSDPNHNISEDLKQLSLKLLTGVLNTWGLTSYCDTKIVIWLDHLGSIKNDKIEFLSKIIIKSISNLVLYLDMLFSNPNDLMKDGHNVQMLELVNYVEVNDNEDILMKEVKVPFSFLTLAAIDLLKENSNPYLIMYFSNVMEEYITLIENPHSLAEYLLQNKTCLCLKTKQFLKAYVNREFIENFKFPQESLLSRLKTLFMTRDYSCVAEFCKECLDQQDSSYELISLCKHILLYLQSQHKKTKKFSLRILEHVLQSFQNASNNERFYGCFEYLINHPFILNNYCPFFSSKSLENTVWTILTIVLENYQTLHQKVKPFWDKIIYELNTVCINEIDSWVCISMFLSKYSHLNYMDLENLILPLVNVSLPYSEGHIEVLSEAIHKLIENTPERKKISEELTSSFLSNILSWSQQQSLKDKEKSLMDLVSTALSLSMDSEMIQALKPGKEPFLLRFISNNSYCIDYLSKYINYLNYYFKL